MKLEPQSSHENNEKCIKIYSSVRQTDSSETIIDSLCSSLEIPSISQASIRAIEQSCYSINHDDNSSSSNFVVKTICGKKFIASSSKTPKIFRENWDNISLKTNKSFVSKYLKVSSSKITSFSESRNCKSFLYVDRKSK